MKTIVSNATAVVAIVVLFWPGAIVAHDLRGVITQQKLSEQSATQQQQDVLKPQMLQQVSAKANIPVFATRSVITVASVWPAGHKLSICFIGGSGAVGTDAVQRRILRVITHGWQVGTLTANRLIYDGSFSQPRKCDNPPTADIKVAFFSGPQYGGWWSYIGTESLTNTPSMNFDGFTMNYPPDPRWSGVVLHEMGHALGLEHEHQSPNAPDCRWAYSDILTAFQWSGATEDERKKDMLHNLQRLQNTMVNGVPRYVASAYDSTSVMHYYFDPKYFTDRTEDKCYIPRDNNKPSHEDIAGLQQIFGPQLAHKQNLLIQYSAKLSTALGSQFKSLKTLLRTSKLKLQTNDNAKIQQELPR